MKPTTYLSNVFFPRVSPADADQPYLRVFKPEIENEWLKSERRLNPGGQKEPLEVYLFKTIVTLWIVATHFKRLLIVDDSDAELVSTIHRVLASSDAVTPGMLDTSIVRFTHWNWENINNPEWIHDKSGVAAPIPLEYLRSLSILEEITLEQPQESMDE